MPLHTALIAALVIAAVAVKEGREAWRGDACCAIPAPSTSSTAQIGGGCSQGHR